MEGRRRITLYEQMTASRRDSLASLFLNDVVSPETATVNTTTLLDIIKEDEDEDDNKNNTKDGKSWKAFIGFLRLKRTETVRSSTVRSDIPSHTNNNNDSNSYSNRITLLSQFSQQQNGVVEEEDSNNNHDGPADVAVAEPGNMLLMDLLEETDPETELIEGSGYKMSEDDDYEKEEEEEKSGVGNNKGCCVCMVRDKGAAFIPCGHTFCRMCCREIWVSRGNCPLCNNFILEILHLF